MVNLRKFDTSSKKKKRKKTIKTHFFQNKNNKIAKKAYVNLKYPSLL